MTVLITGMSSLQCCLDIVSSTSNTSVSGCNYKGGKPIKDSISSSLGPSLYGGRRREIQGAIDPFKNYCVMGLVTYLRMGGKPARPFLIVFVFEENVKVPKNGKFFKLILVKAKIHYTCMCIIACPVVVDCFTLLFYVKTKTFIGV